MQPSGHESSESGGEPAASQQSFITIGTGGMVCRLMNKARKTTGIRCSVEYLTGAPGVIDAGAVAPSRIVGNAIGRIGYHQQWGVGTDKRLDGGRIGTIAAGEPMRPEAPDITDTSDRCLGQGRNVILVCKTPGKSGRQRF